MKDQEKEFWAGTFSYGSYWACVTDHLDDIGQAFQFLQVSVSPYAKMEW